MNFEIPDDLKRWQALACPVQGLRFDARTLRFLDADDDGRILAADVLAALDCVKARGVSLADLFASDGATDQKRLADVLAQAGDLDKLPPTAEESEAEAYWKKAGEAPAVSILGAATAEAEAALAAVEGVLDGFFTPADDLPLVMDAPEAPLPLSERIHPKYAEAVAAFSERCVTPLLGAHATLTRLEWNRLKKAFQPYRAWRAAKPERAFARRAELEGEERFLSYKLHLGEFLRNFVTMDALAEGGGTAIFQTGVLRLGGRELSLCFDVADEAAHAALVGSSNCCVVYLKLTRADEPKARCLAAVVTAGTISGFYAGRNGVFHDRDGRDWSAVVTRVVENQVSLSEAFWAPWRKIGSGIASTACKFLGDRQKKAEADVTAKIGAATAKTAGDAGTSAAGGAAMASSVAAIGIGVGMVGAAFASIMAVVSRLGAWQLVGSLALIVAAVSLPSVCLTWFKLRRRDLGVVLNASGWAVRGTLRIPFRRARQFTLGAPRSALPKVLAALAILLLTAASAIAVWHFVLK